MFNFIVLGSICGVILGLAPAPPLASAATPVGDSVTAARASHWRDVSRECPHCQAALESVEHQLWQCPRWDRIRQQVAGRHGLDARQLGEAISPLTAHSLLRPPCQHRQAAAVELQVSLAGVAVLRPRARVGGGLVTAWTDGAGSRAASCGLTRAAWGAHFSDGSGPLWGGVPGPQSVQRAELYAVVVAASVIPGPLLVVTDSQYVARGVSRLVGRLRP